MKTHHYLLILLGILILILIPIAIYMPRHTGTSTTSTSTPAVQQPTSTAPSDWLQSSEAGITFRYPASLGTTYEHPVNWPPKVTATAGALTCTASENEMGKTEQKTINGNTYCVTTRSEGAAGTIYTDYTYQKEMNGKTVALSFSMAYPQCANYPEPKQTECTNERTSVNLEDLAAEMLESATLQ